MVYDFGNGITPISRIVTVSVFDTQLKLYLDGGHTNVFVYNTHEEAEDALNEIKDMIRMFHSGREAFSEEDIACI